MRSFGGGSLGRWSGREARSDGVTHPASAAGALRHISGSSLSLAQR